MNQVSGAETISVLSSAFIARPGGTAKPLSAWDTKRRQVCILLTRQLPHPLSRSNVNDQAGAKRVRMKPVTIFEELRVTRLYESPVKPLCYCAVKGETTFDERIG